MGNGNELKKKRFKINRLHNPPNIPSSLDLVRSLADKSLTKRLSYSAAKDFRHSLLHRELMIEGRHLSKKAINNLAKGKGIPITEEYVARIMRGAARGHMRDSIKKAGKGILKTGTNIGLKRSAIGNPSLEPTINLTGRILADVIKGEYNQERWWWEYGRHRDRVVSGIIGPVKLSDRRRVTRIEDLVEPKGEITIGNPIITRTRINRPVKLTKIKGLPKFKNGLVVGPKIDDIMKNKYMDKIKKYDPSLRPHKAGVPPSYKHNVNRTSNRLSKTSNSVLNNRLRRIWDQGNRPRYQVGSLRWMSEGLRSPRRSLIRKPYVRSRPSAPQPGSLRWMAQGLKRI